MPWSLRAQHAATANRSCPCATKWDSEKEGRVREKGWRWGSISNGGEGGHKEAEGGSLGRSEETAALERERRSRG